MKMCKYPLQAELYSSLAQSVERMTVNHDVAGSSPAGGAKRRKPPKRVVFSFVFLLLDLYQRHLSAKVTSAQHGWRATFADLLRKCGAVPHKANLPQGLALVFNPWCRWFKPSRGSHRYRTILQPVAKSIVLQGFFVVVGQKTERKK